MSIKVLILGNYHEGPNGWAVQLTNHILSLDLVGVDVIPRRVNITGQLNQNINSRILELEKNDARNPDVVILNTLPTFYEKSGRVKTVGYYVVETSNFVNCGWTSRINLLDAGLVPCFHNKKASIRSGVKIPLFIVPECMDTSRYAKEYDIHPIKNQFKDKFIFLCVSEWTQRKNIDAIIRAFHTEFAVTEPVELVIKTTPAGMSNPQQDINNRLEAIKKGLKLYNDTNRYKHENVICGFLSEGDLASLYKSCNAFVCASRGEAFGIPVADALGFGLPVVSAAHSGLDYLNDKNAFIVQSTEQPCFNANDTLTNLYSSKELWNEISISSLCEQMRAVYEKRALAIKRVQAGRETAKQFSYEVVGRKYREVLEKLL